MLDFIMTVWAWVEAVPIIIALCSLFTALTPTPKDDKMWAKVYKWIDVLALNIGKAKEQAGIK